MSGFEHKILHRSQVAFREAFMSLLFEQPYDTISITDICNRAGYSRTAFYENFSCKQELVDFIVQYEIDEYVLLAYSVFTKKEFYSINNGPTEFDVLFLEHVYEYKEIYSALIRDMLPNHNEYSFCMTAADIFINQKPNIGYFFPENQSGLDRKLFIYLEMGRKFQCIRYWAFYDFSFSPKYISEQLSYVYRMQKITTVALHNNDASIPWYLHIEKT